MEFHNRTSLSSLGWEDDEGRTLPCRSSQFGFGCRYVDGTHYLEERYGFSGGQDLEFFLDRWFNFGVCFVFPAALFLVNAVLYLVPLPAFVKAKFRE